jgi:hypothetical protein
MKTQHTPGPWFLDTASDGSMEIVPQIGYTITVITPRAGFERDIPNARLMAAAPELLYALQACHSILTRLGPPPITRGGHCEEQDFATARLKTVAALKKATQP